MDELWTTKQAAAYFKTSLTTFRRLTREARFPKPIQYGTRRMLWRGHELQAWLSLR